MYMRFNLSINSFESENFLLSVCIYARVYVVDLNYTEYSNF